MALPPTIPTSFVPHAAGAAPQKFRSDFGGAFGFFAYGVLGIVFLLALGVFSYDRLLVADRAAKDTALAKAVDSIDQPTVESFVRLRNRLNQSETLLKKHVAFSNFFGVLETLLPGSVRFSTLHIALDSTGVAKIDAAGTAKSFNALASASTAFAADGRIKDAIFSKISINKDNSVNFGLTASLDPKLMAFSPNAALSGASVPAAPAATTTP